MPTLEQLDTPYERRRVIEYGVDGNKVVRHWHDVQHIAGPLYKSKEEKNMFTAHTTASASRSTLAASMGNTLSAPFALHSTVSRPKPF